MLLLSQYAERSGFFLNYQFNYLFFLISYVRYHVLGAYSYQRVYLPTRVALTNPTTTGSRSAKWLRLFLLEKP